MNRGKIKKILLKAIAIGVLSITLLCGSITKTAKPTAANVNIPKIEYHVKDERLNTKQNVLIYCSHSEETYIDGYSVQDGAKDLAAKLQKKGINVTFLTSDFSNMSGGYNNAYGNSGNQLRQMDLSRYNLIIDYHRDSGVCSTVVNKYGNESAKVMAVLSRNYNKDFNKVHEMVKNMSKDINNTFGNGIYKQSCIYNRGIFQGFNSGLADNMVLLEFGEDRNTFTQIRTLNTEVAYGIANTLINNK